MNVQCISNLNVLFDNVAETFMISIHLLWKNNAGFAKTWSDASI